MGVVQLTPRAVGWILKTASRNFPVPPLTLFDAQRLEKLFMMSGMNPVPATLVHILIQNQESKKDKNSNRTSWSMDAQEEGMMCNILQLYVFVLV
jgi:hypothetical protein